MNPATEQIWSIGPLGDRDPVSRAQAIAGLGLTVDTEFRIQFWMDADTDIYCRVRRLDTGQIVCEFDLDGKTLDERHLLVRHLLNWVRAERDRTAGVVFDLSGDSLEVDWDPVLAAESVTTPAGTWPAYRTLF